MIGDARPQTLPVQRTTRERLRSFGREGERYDDILRRLMEIAEESASYERQVRILNESRFHPYTKYRVLVSDEALGFLRELDAKQRDRVVAGLHELEKEPFRPRPHADIKNCGRHHGSSSIASSPDRLASCTSSTGIRSG